MLKFFTKIRRRLLDENKFSRYILYASGEIILVVVGILIAIQINDWNRESVLLSEEKEAYHIIITDLKRDSILFDVYKNTSRSFLDSYFQLNNMKNGIGYFKDTSPDLIVSNIEFNPVVQKNNLLIIDKLRNKIIRNQLNSYFRRLNQVQQATQEFNELITNKSRPFFLEENNIFKNDLVFNNQDRTFPPFKGVSVVDTISLEKTFNKKYFTPILSELRMSVGFYQAALERGATENHKLIKVLQDEVK